MCWKKGCPRVKTFGRIQRWWSKGVICQVLYLSESFWTRKMLCAFHELPSMLSGSEWFRPESGDSSGAEEFLNSLLDTQPQHSDSCLSGSPEWVRRIAGDPWVMARCGLVSSRSLWSIWETMDGWIPAPHQTLTWTSMHPAFQIKEIETCTVGERSQNHRITESQNSRGWKGPLWVI